MSGHVRRRGSFLAAAAAAGLAVLSAGLVAPTAAGADVSVTASVPSTIALNGDIRDFEHTNNVCSTGAVNGDFERSSGTFRDTGIVGPSLAADGTPVYAPGAGN